MKHSILKLGTVGALLAGSSIALAFPLVEGTADAEKAPPTKAAPKKEKHKGETPKKDELKKPGK